MFYYIWLIQILTESLPISSSGHIKLINKLLNNKLNIPEYIEYLMHIPTFFILVYFISPRLDIFLNCPVKTIFIIFTANLFTLLFYILFKQINNILKKFPLYLGFFITALLLFSCNFLNTKVTNNIYFYQAIFIGIAQGLALLPGVSRLAATYVTGCWLSLSPSLSLTFSCLIQLPLILAAILKSIYKDKILTINFFRNLNLYSYLAIFIISIFSYNLLLTFSLLAKSQILWIFGLYMVIPSFISIIITTKN